MKINARIAAGANRSLTRMPLPALDMADCLNANGKLDRAKAIKAFPAEESDPGYRPFMHSSRDDECVYFAALTFLELMHDAYQEVIANPKADCQERETCREDAKVRVKMDAGKYVHVVNDLRRVSSGVVVRVTVGNPHEVVGKVWLEATTFATLCVQLWLRIAEQVKWLRVEADADILDAARRENHEAELRRINDRRLFCERRTASGHCSPCKFDCPHCKGGKCVEVRA